MRPSQNLVRALALIFLLGSHASAHAAPSVFVRAESGYGWWLREMEARILGKSAGSTTVRKLSDYLAETMLYSPYKVCALESADRGTYVGLDRPTQLEIDETMPNVEFRIEATTPSGRKVIGQSVVFEGCDPEDPRGAALLVTDSATGEILKWEPMGVRYGVQGKSHPAWVMFLYVKEDDELFSYSGCTECGARTSVYFDVTRQKIYLEYNGH
jgi:hypothetical protein